MSDKTKENGGGVSSLDGMVVHPVTGTKVHKDELKPRDQTWLHERANFEEEIRVLRERNKLLEAALLPFAKLVRETNGRVPSERLSGADWHRVAKAMHNDRAELPGK